MATCFPPEVFSSAESRDLTARVDADVVSAAQRAEALGVGVGVRPAERREMEQFGVDYGRRDAVLDETLDIVTSLWSGESVRDRLV